MSNLSNQDLVDLKIRNLQSRGQAGEINSAVQRYCMTGEMPAPIEGYSQGRWEALIRKLAKEDSDE